MRIIAGEWRGRRLSAPVQKGVRPTLDAARESIFNILNNHIDFEGIRVCDLCAGTGALGFEALSRGAAYCSFVEKNRTTAHAIRRNAQELGVESTRYEIIVADARKFVQQEHEEYMLILSDPPYKEHIISTLVEGICSHGLLAAEGIMVAEHEVFESLTLPPAMEQFNSRNFGETLIDFLRWRSHSPL